MKLAFISDIHANLPALKSVLKDIKKHTPNEIFCLGDLVNFAGWDNEVINLIRSRQIPSIQGNHDEGIALNKNDFPFSYGNEAEREFGYSSIQLVNKTISRENRDYLSHLPFMIELEFLFPQRKLKLILVHGSIYSNRQYLKENTPDAYLLEMMRTVNADILLIGHTHIPYHRVLFYEEGSKKRYFHVINAGSVGKSKQGNNKACYVLINIDHKQDLSDIYFVETQFRFVDYDTEKTIQHIHAIGLSTAYDDLLREGCKK